MRIFRPANPDLRRPAYLQGHTKENFIWQLKMTIVFFVASEVYNWWQDRKLFRELRNSPNA